MGSACTWTARGSPMRWRRPATALPTSRGAPGVDALSFGFVKNGGLNAEALILFRTELTDEVAVRRKRAGHLLSKGRMLAAQLLALIEDGLWLDNARAANGAAQTLAGAAPGRLVYPVEANEIFLRVSAGGSVASARARLRLLRLGAGRNPPGHELGPAAAKRSSGSPPRSRLCEHKTMSEARAENFRAVILPFIIFTTIWGSTWIVIRGQLGDVPPPWSVTYRFVIAAAAMAVVARWKGESLRLSGAGFLAAAILGFLQFVVNFNAVYFAEEHITSGLVATVFALLLIPNSLLGWAFLGQRPEQPFRLGIGGRGRGRGTCCSRTN